MENNNEKNMDQNENTVQENETREEKPVAKKSFPWWIVIISSVVVLAIVIVGVVTLLTPPPEEGPAYGDYTIKIVDGIGNPMSNVMVKITYPDGQTKTRITSTDGLATLKNVLLGDYEIKLEKGFSTASFEKYEYNLTKDARDLRIVVRDEAKSMELFGEIPDGTFGYNVIVGEYDVLASDDISYLVFRANTSGTYKVSLKSDDADATVMYVGIPMFVQTSHRLDGAYDGKNFDVIVQDPATPYVFAIDATNGKDATLTIERSGDAPFDPYYAPWVYVQPDENFKYYNTCTLDQMTILKDNGELITFEISPVEVLNGNIGFNGRYVAKDSEKNIKNITITDEKIFIDSDEYNYSIVNGVPQLKDKNNEFIEDIKFYVSGDINDMDISDPGLSVTKGEDGYYYTSDGQLVYMHISSASKYFDASLALIAGYVDKNIGGNHIGGYVYDGDVFVNKYSYNEMIGKYYEYSDANGLYPLTDELIEAITLHAESNGWWDSSSPSFLFTDKAYKQDNLWLFLCCTAG